MASPPCLRDCPTRDSEANSMLDWPLLVSPRSNEELFRARPAACPAGHRASTRLITHANRGFMELIAPPTHRSAAVHSNDRPVRRTRQRIAETLKQCSLWSLARSGAGRGQNIRCPHARGPVCSSSPRPGTSGHAFCCDGNGERSAVMSVLNVAGPGNRAPPRIVHSVESDSGVVALASLASLSTVCRATN